VEFDVRRSTDGVYYCYHDADLNTITTGMGAIESRDSAYIDAQTLTIDPAMGVKVSRLTEAAKLFVSLGCQFFMEPKGAGISAQFIEDIGSIVESAGADTLCTLITTEEPVLHLAEAVRPAIRRGFVAATTSQEMFDASLAIVKASTNCFLADTAAMILAHPQRVGQALAEGIELVAYIALNKSTVGLLKAISVSKVFSEVNTR